LSRRRRRVNKTGNIIRWRESGNSSKRRINNRETDKKKLKQSAI
jgi:hypothetical protein